MKHHPQIRGMFIENESEEKIAVSQSKLNNRQKRGEITKKN
jgi:hypothetical protein